MPACAIDGWFSEVASTGAPSPALSAGRTRAAQVLAYFGHHKSASTWLSDISRELCAATGLGYAHVTNPRQFGGDLRAFCSRKDLDFLTYSNANRRFVSTLDNFRAFHVIRDPRDIVVSSYFSHLHSHPTTNWPELVEHRSQLQNVDKARGLYLVIDFLQDVMEDLATWDYADPRVLELKMEDVVRAPEESLVGAFAFLGLVDEARVGLPAALTAAVSSVKRRRSSLIPFRISPVPASVLIDTLRRNAFSVKAEGRVAGVENVTSHYRKGIPGDWINYFETGHKEYFKARYADLLVKLGYESDDDW